MVGWGCGACAYQCSTALWRVRYQKTPAAAVRAPEIPAAPTVLQKQPAYTGPALLGAEDTIPQTIAVKSSGGNGSLGIPAIVGLHHAFQTIAERELLIVDGTQGVLIVNPDPVVLAEYRQRQSQLGLERQKLKRLKSTPATTIDGTPVELFANIELPEDMPEVLKATDQLAKEKAAGQVSLFGGFDTAAPALHIDLPEREEWPLAQLLAGLRQAPPVHPVVRRLGGHGHRIGDGHTGGDHRGEEGLSEQAHGQAVEVLWRELHGRIDATAEGVDLEAGGDQWSHRVRRNGLRGRHHGAEHRVQHRVQIVTRHERRALPPTHHFPRQRTRPPLLTKMVEDVRQLRLLGLVQQLRLQGVAEMKRQRRIALQAADRDRP